MEDATTPKTESIVEEAKRRFELAHDFYSRSRQLAIEDTRFAMGDSDNLWQWPEAMAKDRSINQRVVLTVNVTAQHCGQVINNIRQNRPASKVSPVDDYGDKRTAEILEGLLRNIKAASGADEAHDNAAEHAVYGGEGYWRIRTDYVSYDSFDQDIIIDAIPNPNLVYVDCYARKADRSDAEWGFIFEDVSKEEAKRDHPGIEPASWAQDSTSGWVQENTVRRAEYFYCTYADDTLCLMPDGSTALKSDLAPEQHRLIVNIRPTKKKQWKWCLLVGGEDKPVDEKDWPGAYLPIITVVGKELNIDGEILRKGLVRDLKDTGRMINYAYSETVQSLALQNKVPYMAAAEAIQGYENIWQSANRENLAYLPFNAYDDSGNPLPRPERQPGNTLATAQVQLLQLSTDEMRAASGQNNASFGIKSEASSGVGIQRLKVQGETATFHFPDNLARALRYEDIVLIDLVQKVFDTRRVVRVLGLDGKASVATLDPSMPQAYAEQQAQMNEIAKIFNPSLGRYDVVIDTGPSFQTQRQEGADRMIQLTQANPALMQVAGDLVMRAQDFPMSEQLADRLAKTLPPNLLDDKQQQIPPQIQQQFAQMQQGLEQMSQALQAADGRVQELEKGEQLDFAKHRETLAAQERIAQAKIAADLERERIKAAASQYKVDSDNDTKRDIADLNATTDIITTGMEPSPLLQAATDEDLTEEITES